MKILNKIGIAKSPPSPLFTKEGELKKSPFRKGGCPPWRTGGFQALRKIAFATLALATLAPVATAFQSLTTTPSDSGFQSGGAYILSKDSNNTFDRSTDSLEAISDKLDNLPWSASGSDIYFSSGNVGIGTTAPVRKLQVHTTDGTSSGVLITTSNSGATDSDGFFTALDSANNAYLIQRENAPMLFYTNGAEVMRIMAGGNIGIGTTDPQYKISLGSTSHKIGLYSDAEHYSYWQPYDSNGDMVFKNYWQSGAADIVFQPDGNVGIGTTAPGGKLHVVEGALGGTPSTEADSLVVENSGNTGVTVLAGASSTAGVYFGDDSDTDEGRITYTNSDQALNLFTANSQAVKILSSGNVGIGTTTPTEKLLVHGSLNSNTQSNNFSAGGVRTFMDMIDASKIARIGTAHGGDTLTGTQGEVGFYVNGSEKVRIDASGNVGIGTTTPVSKLDIDGEVQVGNSATSCSASNEGAIRFNSTEKIFEGCNGTSWTEMSSAVVGDCGTITDSRDGKTYGTVRIGNQCWMAQNLNVGTMIAGASNQTNNSTIEKYCYGDNAANCTAHGGLYQWDEAMQYIEAEGAQGICPTGWHVPTDSEQNTLDQYLATGTCVATRSGAWDCDPAGTALKSGGTSGFDAYLAGGRYADGAFYGQGSYTSFWSSTPSGSNAWRRYLYSDYSTVNRYAYVQTYGFSVRCLQD